MSRHRDIRNMDYTDDYHGYDDIYGHSVDDDYYISPSNRQFIYNRENSRDQPKIGEYLRSEHGIQEEDDDDDDNVNNKRDDNVREKINIDNTSEEVSDLTDLERAKLESCLDQIQSTLNSLSLLPKNEIINIAIAHDFNPEQTIDAILKEEELYQKQETEQTSATTQPIPIPSATTSAAIPLATNLKPLDLQQTRMNPIVTTTTPRSQSPASGRGTPTQQQQTNEQIIDNDDVVNNKVTTTITTTKNRDNKIDIVDLYKKERAGLRNHLYMVVIGHVDAGKSTLMGHFLCDLGQVNQKTMHKYEQESRKLGKQSFLYAWVLDETGEERNRGITMDIGRSQFETKTKYVTLLDAPGHKDFIPNMISGAGQADVALLVVDATRGEFETGFDYGGQTREHALLVRSLGVTQLVCCINKLDTVNWSEERFNEIVMKLKQFLKQAGFKENDVTFVPCSGLTGQNLINKPTENGLRAWYNGPCLLEVIDNFRIPERPVSKPFRLSVYDTFKGTGSGNCVSGKVETGSLTIGERVLVCPNRELFIVKSLFIDNNNNNQQLQQQRVYAGDEVTIVLSGIDNNIQKNSIQIGNLLCNPQYPIPITQRFHGRIVLFNNNIKIPITKGYQVLLHYQTLVEPVIISRLIAQLNKTTGELIKKHPRYLSNNTSGIVEIQTTKPIACELYSDCKELGRFMLRANGVTIAAGLIVKIL